MATGGAPSNQRDYNGYPKTMYTSRTRSMLPSSAPRSNSAMSSRTYSRVKENTPSNLSRSVEIRRNMHFEEEDSSQLDNSLVNIEELQNEQELLERMIDQQKQLQELRDRQKRVLELQQQLASMEESAEYSMEEKLGKLNTAKTRLDELQKLVSTIKSDEAEGKKGSGDSPVSINPDNTQQVKRALDELNELKTIIGLVSEDAPSTSQHKPIVSMEPVFANSVEADEQVASNYQPVLPEVSVVQYDDVRQDSPRSDRRNSSRPRKHSASKGSGRRAAQSPLNLSPNQRRRSSSTKKKTVRTVSPKKEEQDSQGSERLFEEMRRHQILLKELRERRQELEELMNMTRGTQDGEQDEEGEEREDEYIDNNASIRSNQGSPDESREASDNEANDFDTSQSGRLFGLNETDTRRLIDLIRNQKNLGATTEKTTATWGSSTTNSIDSDDNDDTSPSARNDRSSIQLFNDKNLSKVSDWSQRDSTVGISVRDAFTQLNCKEEHEIDFRPPTRRRRNMTRPENKVVSLDPTSYSSTVSQLQEGLIASNNTMHILLEDQLSLIKLLLNTLNLQQTTVSSNICYGISPDFLIYQLDNCSAQFAATLKETKDMQWQVYGLTKGSKSAEKNITATRMPLATLNYVPAQQTAVNQNRADLENFHLQMSSPARDMKAPKLASSAEVDAEFQQSGNDDEDRVVYKGEANGDSGNDLFEALRDSIYSEAAILISQNESRPHFLIELFHTLQQLNTDYLRQHALYTLQDIMKGYLPSSPRKRGKERAKKSSPRNNTNARNVTTGSFSENTPSESPATSEDEGYAKLKAEVPEANGYDFPLKVSSASELSSPSDDDTENNPFAADDLGSTVIHLDAALRHMREMERIKQEMQTSARARKDSANTGMQDKTESTQINTKVLRVWIKNIISEIIPILKDHHDRAVDKKLVKLLRSKVLECVSKGIDSQQLMNGIADDDTGDDADKLSIADFFSGQLRSILDDSFAKYFGQTVGSCGEDMIVGLSEILFNELAFFHMMQGLGKEKQAAEKKTNIPVIRIDQDEGVPLEQQDATESNSQEDEVNEDAQNEGDSEVSNTEDNVPGLKAEDEDEGRIDSRQISPNPFTLDLSVSETKPLTSYGSGEDEEEEGSGDEFEYGEPDVPTSMQHDANEAKENLDEKQDDGKEEDKVEDPTSQDAPDIIDQRAE